MITNSFERNLKKLKSHKLAVWGFWTLVFLYVMCVFADFIAPYCYDSERREHSYHPPMAIHFFDENNKFHPIPFVYGTKTAFNEYYETIVINDYSKKYSLKFFYNGEKHYALGFIPVHLRIFGVVEPGRIYIMGADARGRDLFSRIMYGSRVSLSVGITGVAITLLIGLIIGGISGYYGKRTDTILMRLCEMIMMVPSFYLMLAMRAAFPMNLSSSQVYILLVIIMSFIGWASLARIIRGMVLSIKSQAYVEAAEALGVKKINVIIKHILPQTLSYVIVSVTLAIPSYMLGESGLSLIGLGIQDPQASWGNLLSDAMAVSEIRYHPWILIPGIFIFVSVMAFNFLGDGLRDAFDPKA